MIKAYLPNNLDVIELGSSIGVVSCIISKILSPNKKLICVEANPNLISFLKLNLSNNSPNTKGSVLNGAISYSNTKEVSFRIKSSFLESSIGLDEESVNLISQFLKKGIIGLDKILHGTWSAALLTPLSVFGDYINNLLNFKYGGGLYGFISFIATWFYHRCNWVKKTS